MKDRSSREQLAPPEMTTAELVDQINQRLSSPTFTRNRLSCMRYKHTELKPIRRVGPGVLLWPASTVERVLDLLSSKAEIEPCAGGAR